ncbi:MAG: thiamine diphosphokinase [Ostreibacterium sp.]
MITHRLPLAPAKTLIFLNGNRSNLAIPLSHLSQYQQIIAVDGAWNDLKTTSFAPDILAHGLIIGDGDSIIEKPKNFIQTINQNKTDFEKTVCRLIHQNVTTADIYWGSGGEMDHFLGNLSVAAKYAKQINCRFFDGQQCYFYASGEHEFIGGLGQTISLYPFPKALITSQGLQYEMSHFLIKQDDKQSLRNSIIIDKVTLSISGNSFIFITLNCASA